MRITIVIPPLTDFYFTPHRFANHGANILKEIIITQGHEVQWLNFPLMGKKQSVVLPAALKYLQPFLNTAETGCLTFFTHYWRFGPSLEECVTKITAFDPDLVFLACFAFCYANELIELVRMLKKNNPRLPLIVGGAGVTIFPEFFFRQAPIDFIISQEVEVAIDLFMKKWTSYKKAPGYEDVPNLFWREDNTLQSPRQSRFTEAAEIYFTLTPAWETDRHLYLTTSLTRGCPRQCLFCINAVCHGKKFRFIPLSKVEAGLIAYKKRVRSNLQQEKKIYINFEDDNILLAPDYFLNVLEIFRRYFPGADFLVENGMDYMLLTPDIIRQLISHGLKNFNLSLAATDLTILRNEQRFFKPDHFKEVLNEIKFLGGTAISYYICGFKEDTKETCLKTLHFLASLPTSIGISPYYAMPGLPGFEKAAFDRLDPVLCAGSSVYPWNNSLNTETLITAFRLTRLINLVKKTDKTALEHELLETCLKQQDVFTVVKSSGKKVIKKVAPVDAELVELFFNGFSLRHV